MSKTAISATQSADSKFSSRITYHGDQGFEISLYAERCINSVRSTGCWILTTRTFWSDGEPQHSLDWNVDLHSSLSLSQRQELFEVFKDFAKRLSRRPDVGGEELDGVPFKITKDLYARLFGENSPLRSSTGHCDLGAES